MHLFVFSKCIWVVVDYILCTVVTWNEIIHAACIVISKMLFKLVSDGKYHITPHTTH